MRALCAEEGEVFADGGGEGDGGGATTGFRWWEFRIVVRGGGWCGFAGWMD